MIDDPRKEKAIGESLGKLILKSRFLVQWYSHLRKQFANFWKSCTYTYHMTQPRYLR